MAFRTILPSFVADFIWPEQKPAHKLHPTSYLDGLRGLASFIVFFCHYTEDNHGYFTPAYGLNGENETSSWIQLPYFRLIYSGRPMVHIFFVISGFVLSYKPLKCIHSRDLDKCFTVLSSSTFRRPLRLFGPCAVSTLIIALLMQMGYLYEPAPSLSAQLYNWVNVMFHNVAWPWAWDADLRPSYDIHLWTIPIEFTHSMLLFLMILCMSRLKLVLRQATTFLIMIYAMCCGKWATFEFFGGMFLAEIHVLKASRAKVFGGALELPYTRKLSSPATKAVLHITVWMLGWYVGGWPNQNADKTPGIRYLLSKTPTPFLEGDMPQRFWFAIAAVFIVWSAGEVDAIRKFLEGGLAQYCGRVSYAIYIVHGAGLQYFQGRVMGRPYEPPRGAPGEEGFAPAVEGSGVRGMIGIETSAQRVMAWVVGLLILGPIIVWLSDLFWRFVDAPIVTMGRNLENACVDNAPETKEHDGYSLA